MNGRIVVMIGLLQFLSGGAVQAGGLFGSGENASYSVRNIAPREMEDVQVVGATGMPYAGQLRQPANTWKPSPQHPRQMPSFGGNHLNPHKIPEEVLITWREMPPSGGQPYTGELNGPYQVKVRERIPKEVLNAASKNGYLVELSFSAGELPIRFNWKLIDFVSLKHGTKDWCIGGDSFQDPSEKEVQPGNTYAAPIPVWPHCKLP